MKLTAMQRRETEKRITKKYPLPSDHSAIIATRFDLLFKRRADSVTLKRNGLVCFFLPSVIQMGNLLLVALYLNYMFTIKDFYF